MNQVDSTRFVFFLVYFIAHLSSLKLFFQQFSGTKNTIPLIFHLNPNVYTFVQSWESWLVQASA